MDALTVTPGVKGSLAVRDLPEPDPALGDLLVEGVALGICGTDHEIVDAQYGQAPPGSEHLVLGHESLGWVLEAPADSGFAPGDLVVGVVRMPDPQPCGACAHGEWDMCRNGRYTEHGIKQLHGFGSRRWRIPSAHAVRVDPQLGDLGVLLEPTTVVAKAWEQVDQVGGRAWFAPQRVLITGAGPIGLLGAMIGAQRGLEVHVLDRATEGPKPGMVQQLGGTYHTGDARAVLEQVQPDVVVECTGAVPVISACLTQTVPYCVTVLTGISAPRRDEDLDLGMVNRDLVLDNGAVVGSVNANLRHYRAGADALAAADRDWLAQLITRRVPLEDFAQAFERRQDDVKVVLTLG